MAKKKLSWSEQICGRPCPPMPKIVDEVLANYVKADGAFCGRFRPEGSWTYHAFTTIRRNGWVEASALSFGKGMELYFLTDRGEPEALAAKERVRAAREARVQWSRDFNEAHLAKLAAEKEAT
ncbi:hypothetical protein A4U53_030995 [Rhizobium ruizarguesonis]|uniref:Uncharacterized protein n=2 Tax=Rhizobium TaxID=379 RepID=A0A179BVE5_RHILE|nr:hypothetical protein [Rhizobium leguminosarum]OAP95131.1 hypothetical protein A4U53_18085 [Rhizobium leguminosarum]